VGCTYSTFLQIDRIWSVLRLWTPRGRDRRGGRAPRGRLPTALSGPPLTRRACGLSVPARPLRLLPPVHLIGFGGPEFERASDEEEMGSPSPATSRTSTVRAPPSSSDGLPRRRRGRRSRRRGDGQSPARPARRASQARRRSSLKRARALRAARPSSIRAPLRSYPRHLDSTDRWHPTDSDYVPARPDDVLAAP
jgi:hypothetical protein